MSIKKQTFLEISSHLSKNVQSIKYVDKYRGQLDNVSNWVFSRPAVFLSFGRTDWDNVSINEQLGTAIIRVRVVVENYADAYDGSINQEQALEFFDINQDVHKALQGLSGTYFKHLTRITDEDDEDHGNMIVTLFEYECKLIDNSTTNEERYIEVEPDLLVEYNNKEEFPKKAVAPKFIVRL